MGSFASGFFHSAYYFKRSSMLQHVSAFHSFFTGKYYFIEGVTTIFLYIHQQMDKCIVLGYYKCNFYDHLCKKPLHGHMFSFLLCSFSSVQSSHSVMSDSLQPHGLQHARLPCFSLFHRVCSNSCPLSQ